MTGEDESDHLRGDAAYLRLEGEEGGEYPQQEFGREAEDHGEDEDAAFGAAEVGPLVGCILELLLGGGGRRLGGR